MTFNFIKTVPCWAFCYLKMNIGQAMVEVYAFRHFT